MVEHTHIPPHFSHLQQEREQQEEKLLFEDEDEEETLSLCDLPLNNNNNSSSSSSSARRSSSKPTTAEFFEFLTDFTSEMSSAEDIICCGKLIPFKPQHTPHQHRQQQHQQLSFRRRSESLPGSLHSSQRTSNLNSTLTRSSRSLNYCSGRSNGYSGDVVPKKSARPRWYVLMFGAVKPATEMEIYKDMKIRQGRQQPSSMFTPVDGGGRAPGGRNFAKGSGRLLKVLSCKDHASVAVATPYCSSQTQV